ncbi:hypothetical protein NDA01_21445 [Trichocoleus desertorum AS-A10]|uniref:hypothetical protein n=1 Tax=Trichocoleus desertorum TaxID=1481672 RepID=UPI003298DCC9
MGELMWKVDTCNILKLKLQSSGRRFTQFVDALVRAEAYKQGIPLSKISTNHRTTIADKGVDAAVHSAIASSLTGWMNMPTCWQYKATDYSSVSKADLCKEVRKPYSAELIKKGYGYRLCICDDLPPVTKQKWEEILDSEVKRLNASAPKSKVIAASDLAEWVGWSPGIVIEFFKPGLMRLLHLEAWRPNITVSTPIFVEIQAWAAVQQSILEHIDFNQSCIEVTLPIQGEAGVGKTRLVYETLASVEGAKHLVLYAIDAQVLEVAHALANDFSARAILVADECLLKTRHQLINLLSGHSDRIRVICLDNSGRATSTAAAEIWLKNIPEDDVDSILKSNFPLVPADRRRGYVELSRGFVRFAAELCKRDASTGRSSFREALISIEDYFHNCLNNEDKLLEKVEAISLFRKVGFRDDVGEELDCLCKTLNLDTAEVIQTLNKLKDAPGFVAFAGRYLYITPAIIARVSFSGAWQRWAAYDPSSFLSKIPDSLLESFLESVSISASEEVRYVVGDFFRSWATTIKPIDLADTFKVERLVVLVDTDPKSYLPLLRQLIDQASKDELLEMPGGLRGGSRRSLVWLAERMAAFPDFLPHAEHILWKLALAESEISIANNATNVWQQLFSIFLSGTATPFTQRLTLLRFRLFTDDEEQVTLALNSLNHIFKERGSRIVRSYIVSGQLPPSEWMPKDQQELKQCIDLGMEVLSEAAKSRNFRLRDGALECIIRHLRMLLTNGYFEQIKIIFSRDNVSEGLKFQLIENLERLAHFNYAAHLEVQEWLQSLSPTDFHGRLINIVGKSPWHYSFKNDQERWHAELANLAKQLCEQQELLKSEMQWLCSSQASSAAVLGEAIGLQDSEGSCLNTIMNAVAGTEFTGLARGYVWSVLKNHPQHIDAINHWIDQLENQAPTSALELFTAGGIDTKALERALRLIDAGILSLNYLGKFILGLTQRPLFLEEFHEILKRLVSSIKQEPTESVIKTAIELVAYRLQSEQRESQLSLIQADAAIRTLIWELLEETARNTCGEDYHWDQILRDMARIDIDEAIEIASLALVSEDSQQKMTAEKILVDLAEARSEQVMQKVGEVILNEEYSWQFYIEEFRFLIRSLPFEAMQKWLREVGVVGAQRIARSLPIPYLDEVGNPVVPAFTEFVLSEFEEDDSTFRYFCSGSHSLQVYSGDIASQKEKEAEIAKKFINHPLRRVREWAQYEISSSRQDAKFWRQLDEERRID